MTMSDKRLKQLLDQFAVDLMMDDLEHSPWIVLCWSKGKSEGGPPEVAYGPFDSAHEALTKADALSAQIEGAPGRNTFMAGYTATITVVPLYGEEES